MDIGQIVTLVVFVATVIGAVLYLRADARANRQEFKNDLAELKSETNGQLAELKFEFSGQLAEFRADFNAAFSKLSADIEGLNQRVTVLESKVEALDTKIDTKAAELSAQMQRNHRELLIRLAFHHYGDGRYPVSAATDPDPVDPLADGE